MRVAVVHEWLSTYAGSERVLEQILAVLPDADLFAVVDFMPPAERAFLRGRPARTTFVQRLPFARRAFRAYLPLMPLAVEQLDLSGYDLVVSSSHAVAKGGLVAPDALHVCYCYSPLRYAWDLQHEYLSEAGLDRGVRGWATRALLHRMRGWDVRSAAGVDRFIGISHFIARRIRRAYHRRAAVIYPPVDLAHFGGVRVPRGGYYVTASRFVPYKRVPMIVEAFRAMPDRELVVIGDGPQRREVARAAGPNVRLLGHVPGAELARWIAGARAFVFAAAEDFGIAPLEAQAAGTPVVAYAGGALPETVRGLASGDPSGVLYDEQSVDGLRDGIGRFEAAEGDIGPDACRRNAARFSPERFRDEFSAYLTRALAGHRRRLARGVPPSAVTAP